MFNEEIIRLILDIQSTKDPADVAAKFDVLKGKILETSKAFIELDQHCDAAVTSLGKAQVASDKQAEAAVEATRAGKFYAEVFDEMAESAAFVTTETAGLTGSMNQLRGTGGSSGMGILGVSYAVQDFTSVIQTGGGFSRAIGAIQNNIPVILTGLGVGAGLAGAISLVTVGLGAAIPLLGTFADKEKDVAEAAKEATKEIERQKAAADALAGKPSPSQAETAAGVTEYLGLVGGENVRQGIEASIAATSPGEGLDVKERQLLADYEHAQVGKGGIGDALFPGLAADKRRLEEKRAAAVKQRADVIFGTLPTSRDSRETVRRMAMTKPGNFPGLPGLASDLQSFEPEDQAMADARMQVAEEEGAAAHEAGVKRRQAAQQRNERNKQVVEAQKKEDASIRQAGDEEDKAEKHKADVEKFNAKALERAHHASSVAANKAQKAAEMVPATVNRVQKLVQDSQELLQRQAVERDLNQRSGGRASPEQLTAAAKSTQRIMGMMGQNANYLQALSMAEAEQNAKLGHLQAQLDNIGHRLQQNRQRRPPGMRRIPPTN